MLELFYDTNYFETLLFRERMQETFTYDAIQDMCIKLTDEHIPYDVFMMIWNNISKYDKDIYREDIKYDDDPFWLYVDDVPKGSYKYKRNKRRNIKIKRSVRYRHVDLCL